MLRSQHAVLGLDLAPRREVRAIPSTRPLAQVARRLAALALVLCPLGCPQPVKPPPPPPAAFGEQAWAAVALGRQHWVDAHKRPARDAEYSALLARALAEFERANALPGGDSPLVRTVLAQLRIEIGGKDAFSVANRDLVAAVAKDDFFAPAHLMLAEIDLAKDAPNVTPAAIARAEVNLHKAEEAVWFLETGGEGTYPADYLNVDRSFYDPDFQHAEALIVRRSLASEFLSFDLGSKQNLVYASDLGKPQETTPDAVARIFSPPPGQAFLDLIKRMKARCTLVKAKIDMARFQLDGVDWRPLMREKLRVELKRYVFEFDPEYSEGVRWYVRILQDAAETSPRGTDDAWKEAFNVARTQVDGSNPLLSSDPEFRRLAYEIAAGFAARLFERAADGELSFDEIRRQHSDLFEKFSSYTATYLGDAGAGDGYTSGRQCEDLDILAARARFLIAFARYRITTADPAATLRDIDAREFAILVSRMRDVVAESDRAVAAEWNPRIDGLRREFDALAPNRAG